MAEGIRYAAGRKDLLGTYLIDTIAMTTAMPTALFPFLAAELHASHAVGLLYAADSVGGLLAGAVSGWVRRVHRHGLAIVLAALGWGAAMGLAGVMPSLPLVLVMLACAGAADMVSGTFRGIVWDQTIPDELRGRLAGIELLSYSIGPTLGNARAGAMAVGGVRFSIASGGALCVLGVGVAAAALPRFRPTTPVPTPSPSPSATGGPVTRQAAAPPQGCQHVAWVHERAPQRSEERNESRDERSREEPTGHERAPQRSEERKTMSARAKSHRGRASPSPG